MERGQIYSLAVLLVCAMIGIAVVALLMAAMNGRLGRPGASPPPAQDRRGLTAQEMLERIRK